MNNADQLKKHIRKYNSRPYPQSGYFGLSEEEYFPQWAPPFGYKEMSSHKPNSFITLKHEFENISKRVNDISEIAERQISIIDLILSSKNEDYSRYGNQFTELEQKEMNTFNEAFKTAFNDYMSNPEEPDFNDTDYSEHELYGVYYGVELAKYKSFVLKSQNPVEQSTTKELEFKMPQKILTLEFLGIIDSLEKSVKSKEALYQVLHYVTGDSKHNIKKQLTKKLSDRVKLRSNRSFLVNLQDEFDEAGLETQANKIKEALKE